MRLTVIVKPNASFNKVIKHDDATYQVFTTATPEHGKANQKVIELLADFLGVAPSQVSIHFGKTAREKIVEVEE